jgi:glycosyltransferase involved in cell wall biosynthesis
MGQATRSFPEAGFYDSCRACIEFLNAHSFEEYFPLIDLTTFDGAAKAVKETLAVVLNLNAMMYRCYFNTSLLERLGEWLSQSCPEEIKQTLMPQIEGIIGKVSGSQLPQEVKTALLKFSENMVNDFHFSPHDFSKEAAQCAQKLFSAGESERAESIKRYLSLIKSCDLQPINRYSEDDVKQQNFAVSGSHIFTERRGPKRDQTCPSDNQLGPLVSVVMPAYNAAKYIVGAIESVLAQSYRNFELVIVDDGSTDNTGDIVSGFKDDRIKYFYKENAGASSARNLAIKKSKGDFIANLDTDDLLRPSFITGHLREFERHPEADLVYCDDYLLGENGKPMRVIERQEYTDRKSLIRDLFLCPVLSFRTCVRRSVFDKIGFYDEQLVVAEDYDMLRRFIKQGLKMHHLKAALYVRRVLSSSLSRNFTAQTAESHLEVLKRFPDTFRHDELFPDVDWDKIHPEAIHLHTKCLTAVNYFAMGQVYTNTDSPVYAKAFFKQACSELDDCLEMAPDSRMVKQLFQKFELARIKAEETEVKRLLADAKDSNEPIRCAWVPDMLRKYQVNV